MSETVFYTGTLTRVTQPKDASIEEQAKHILVTKGVTERDSYNATWLNQLMDDGYGEYVQLDDGFLYLVERQKKSSDGDIFQAKKNEDGSISFTVKYYNGGCSFNEAIDYAMENLESTP